jgi:hypothetical protein
MTGVAVSCKISNKCRVNSLGGSARVAQIVCVIDILNYCVVPLVPGGPWPRGASAPYSSPITNTTSIEVKV